MKKVVLLSLMALMLCVFPTNMRADDVCHTIGSATNTDNMPGANSLTSYIQMIFTKEELTAAGVKPGNIKGIKFNWSVTAIGNKSLSMNMVATTKSVFVSGSDYETVSSPTFLNNPPGYWSVSNIKGTLPNPDYVQEGENTYTFDSPFVWDGNSNIVIATKVNDRMINTSGYQPQSIGFTARGSDCGVNRCIVFNGTTSIVGNPSAGIPSTFRPAVSFCQDYCPDVTNLTASDVSYTSATISWDACASCTNGYDVVCSSSPVTDFSAATIQHVSTNSVSLTGLSIHTGYYVYVRSCCGIYSDWSEALQFKTLSDCGDPGNVAITDIGKHQMTLNWNTSPKATSYDIIVSLAELADPSSAEVTYANVTGSSKVLGNLRCETTYHVYICANCGTNGYSDWTHVSATTLPVERYDCDREDGYVCGTGTDFSYLVHPVRSCNYIQQIYTADELHALGFTAGLIKAVEFNFQNDSKNEQYHMRQSVYIGTTEKDTFAGLASEFVDGLTQVYGPTERTCPNAGGWLRYSFNTPFYWDGVSNVVIGFLSNKCNDPTAKDGWNANGTTQKDNNNQDIYRAIFTCSDNYIDINNINDAYRNNIRSNIRFVACFKDTDPCPTISNTPVASNITHNEATITLSVISEEDIASYDIIASEEEITDFTNVQPTHPGIITTTTSCRLTSLNPETDYYVYVRVNCVNGDLSQSSFLWSPACQFRTDEFCKTPYNLSVNGIAERAATLCWNVRDNNATAFELVASKVPLTDPSAGTVHDITATNNAGACNYALDHLTHNTHYYLYIRTDCGGDASSHWSSVDFITRPVWDCNNGTMVVANGTVTNNMWPVCSYEKQRYITQSIYPESMLEDLVGKKITKLKYFVERGGSTDDATGSGWGNTCFYIRMMTTQQSTVSDLVPATADATTVYYRDYLSADVQNGMVIELNTPFEYNGGNLLIEFESSTNTDRSKCDFYGIDAGSNVSVIKDLETAGSPATYTFLPKVEFTICEKMPICPALSAAPVASGVTYNAATITWNAGTSDHAITYDMIVSESEIDDFTGETPTYTGMTATSYNITGLNENTRYYVYVRVNCSAGGYDDGSSLWSPACEFTTEPFCAAPENFAVAGKTSTSARLTWTKRGAAESWKIHVAQDNEITVTGNDCQITGKQVSYTLTGLTPNTNYNLRLQSIDESCTDDLYANDLSFRTLNTVIGITSFRITNAIEIGDVNIDTTNHTISVTTIYGTDLSDLAFTLRLADAKGIAKVGDNTFTGPWDFTSPVTIQVYAEDRDITPQQWTITIVNETCATPYNISVTNVDEHNATLNWNVTDVNPTTFDLVVSDVPLTDPSTSDVRNITVTNNGGACNYALGYLVPGRHYYVYIRTNCGNENSHWSFFEFSTISFFDCDSAQAILVADGAVTDQRFPVYGYNCDFTQKTQSIYPSSMLAGLMGNKITKLKYFVQDGGSSNWKNATFNIRMMTTTKSTLSDFVSTANATPVYSGTLRANTTDGMEITLTTPFEYSGDNLLIEFELPVADGWNRCYFYGTEADGDVSCMNYRTNAPTQSTFLPKIEFTVCGKVSACPEVTDIAAANIDETSATITWTASAGMYANTSDIYYSATEVEDFTSVEPQHIGITGTSYQIANLNSYTTYYVYVRTHCDAQGYDDGVSGWAGTSFLTLAQCRVPGDLKATVTGKQTATITWTNTSGDAQQANNFTYILSTTPVAEAALETTATTETGVNTTSVNLTNLQSNTTYYFYIKNVCSGIDCSSPWVSCQFTTPIAMPAVINLQVHDIAHNAFTATWESDSANFANETEWEVACVAHGTQPDTWTQVSVPEYFALGLTAETTYDFYVRAKNGNNYSANAQMEVTTIQKSVVECKDVSVGENGSLDKVPVRSVYMGSYTVQIYTAEQLREFGCTGAGNIKKIAFYQTLCDNTSDASRYRKKTTVWMGNTNKETFDNSQDWIYGLTQVMDEKPIDFNKNGDWVELALDNTFYWDGENNLAVAVLAYSDSYTTMNFAGGSVTGDRSLYAYKDENSWSVTDGVPSYTNGVNITNELATIKLCFESGSCLPVDKLKVDNVTNNTARAHWYPGDTETTWHVYNSTTEMTAAELAALTQAEYTVVSTNPEISLDDLIKDTDYYFYVRAVCGDDEVSHWNCCHYTTSLTCSAPAEAIATTGNNSITFTVNPGDVGTVGTYDYRYWMMGSNDTVTESGKTSPFTVNNLSSDNDYQWEVRANCSGTDEGSSRWVKGNTVHVCGTTTLPYFNDFNQYELPFSAIDCWTVTKVDPNENKPYPLALYGDMCFLGNSAIATPLINVPDEGLKISLRINIFDQQELKVMFTTDLAANESTYTEIATLINDGTNGFSDRVMFFNPEEATQGYIVFSGMIYGNRYCFVDSLLIEAMPTGGIKDVTVDNVTYTISGLQQGNNVTIEEVSFNEDDLTEADFDITYNNTFLNYKHKLDVPATLTDVIKDRYKVVAINAAAFDDVDLTENVRVNVPADVNLTGTLGNGKIVMKLDDGGIHYMATATQLRRLTW